MTKSYKDFITSTLRNDGVCHIQTDRLDLSTANMFAQAYGINFSIVKATDYQGVLRDYYRFWTDSQQTLKHKLLERRKWQWWGELIAVAILVSTVSLITIALIESWR